MKRILAIFVSISILLLMIPLNGVLAINENGIFEAGSISGDTGSIVTVQISVKNNPGVTNMQVWVGYDKNNLELTAISGKDFSGASFGPITANPIAVSWSDTLNPNNTANGILAELTFKIKDNAAIGKTNITLTYDPDNVYNSDWDNVEFSVVNGYVDIAAKPVSVTNVTLNKDKISLKTGEAETLLATVLPENATNKVVTWKSSDASVATVSDTGKVMAIKEGTATITVTTQDGSYSASCTVSVACSHTDKSEEPSKSPDCVNPGNHKYYTCTACGDVFKADGVTETTVEAETLPALKHDFTEKIEDAAHLVSGSGIDCQHVKVYYYDCSRCNVIGTVTFNSTATGEHQMESTWTTENGKHFHTCGVTGCTYIEDEVLCSGGTATCLQKAVCNVCNKEYGELGDHALTHHAKVDADHTKPGNIEYWTCDVCGKYFADASAKNEIQQKDTVIAQIPHSHSSTWSYSTTQHWNECSCGDKINVYDHNYDHACDTICNTCGYTRTITHTWETELSYNTTQHWIECSVCGEKKEEVNHFGGTVDCLHKAICDACGQEYGNFGSHTLTYHAKVEADHTKPGNVEYWTCDVCGKYFADASAKNEIQQKDTVIAQIPHSHSSAWSYSTTQHWNECSCGDKINVYNHNYDNSCDTTCNACGYTRTITHTWKTELSYHATQHWTECSVCGEKTGQESHSGGTADCQSKAVCSDCHQEYGSLGNHALTHHAKVDADHTKPGNIEYWTCDICGKYFADASAKNEIQQKDTVITQIPHSHSSTWSYSTTQHWNECSCGDKINVYDHNYDHACDTICNTCGYTRTITHTWKTELSYNAAQHWTECSVCGEKKGLENHHGGTATCQGRAVCADCGQPYGELTGCDFTAEKAEPQYLKSEATCIAKAVYYKSCTVCGKASTDTFEHGEVDDTNHVHTEVRDQEDGTCEAAGYTGDTWCNDCNRKIETGTPIIVEHRLTRVDANPATHEADGNIAYYVCQACHQLFADEKASEKISEADTVIPKGDHEYARQSDDKNHWEECDCGSKVNNEAHSYGSWITTQPAGVDQVGSRERLCTVCGYKQTEQIPATETPATGDTTQIGLLYTMLLISACGIAVIWYLGFRQKGKYQR